MLLTRLDRAVRSICSLNRNREFKHLLRHLTPALGCTLLDVGSGDGFWTHRFAQHFDSSVGLEPDSHALALAQRVYGRQARYVRGFAEDLCFAEESFDSVVSVSCLEHFRDPQTALQECYRVLKRGGRIAISVDSLLTENSTQDFRSWHKRKYFVTEYFSEQHLTSMLRQAGFEPESHRTVHIFNSRTSARLREFYLREPRRWLILFPVLYLLVLLCDRYQKNVPGQVLVMTACKPRLAKSPRHRPAVERASFISAPV
jgi:ubiquinone/menaquinone biosynthesis C-methylase UbiE